MNRSFISVILGGFGATAHLTQKEKKTKNQLKVEMPRMQLF